MKLSDAMINRIRVLICVGIFYVLYQYAGSVFALCFAFYCIMQDMADIASDTEKIVEERSNWMNFLTNRKPF